MSFKLQVILEQADYQLVNHDGGSYHVMNEGKEKITTFDMRLVTEYFVKCAKEKSASATIDADEQNEKSI